jgi:hypothetical protein
MENAASTENRSPAPRKKEKLLDLLHCPGVISEPLSTIAKFVEYVGGISKQWQDVDIRDRESDEESFLNDARIVGQVWFRGQGSCRVSLRPGLYREDTWKHLKKVVPSADDGDEPFKSIAGYPKSETIRLSSYCNEGQNLKLPRRSGSWEARTIQVSN